MKSSSSKFSPTFKRALQAVAEMKDPASGKEALTDRGGETLQEPGTQDPTRKTLH